MRSRRHEHPTCPFCGLLIHACEGKHHDHDASGAARRLLPLAELRSSPKILRRFQRTPLLMKNGWFLYEFPFPFSTNSR